MLCRFGVAKLLSFARALMTVGAALGYLLFSEVLNAYTVVGAGLILVAALMVTVQKGGGAK